MFPLKKFVQGPSLHDEQISYAEENDNVPSTSRALLNGLEASKIYEEIINLPSTAAETKVNENITNSLKNPTFMRNIDEPVAKSEPIPLPKLLSLMAFCEANNSSSLEDILERFQSELDINAVDDYGWTLLMSASCAGSIACVSVLLKYGASWEIKDKKGLTALCLARRNRHDQVCNLLEEWNDCYIELCQRKLRVNENGESEPCTTVEEQEEVPSEQYCASCKINYLSSKNDHEKSIAHLVCAAQFGDDRIHYGIPDSNKGFQLMVKSGWDRNRGLGPEGKGHKFPVKTVLKRNKLGLGNETEKKMARITHFAPFDTSAVEDPRREREETVRKREAIRQKNKDKRKEINFRREFSSL